MSISGISHATQSFKSSASTSKAGESIEQLAAEGDPTAIAELKQEELQAQPPKAGASEPGKGEQFDQYV